MKPSVLRTLLCALVIGLVGTAPAHAASTYVWVEGSAAPLLPRTAITIPGAAPGGITCPANSATSLIDIAVGGAANWDRGTAFGSTGNFTQRILGETHAAPANDGWSEWIRRGTGGYAYGGGICADTFGDGDELRMVGDTIDDNWDPTRLPATVAGAPATSNVGAAIAVTVTAYRFRYSASPQLTTHPVVGATVTAGASNATTDGAGQATLTLGQTGVVTVESTGGTLAGNPTTTIDGSTAPYTVLRSAPEAVCVHNGSDGTCGTTAPYVAPPAAETTPAPATSAPTGTAGGAGGSAQPDEAAPVVTIAGLRADAVFARSRGPRLLRGTIADEGTLREVKVRLTRRIGERCWYFSGRSEEFRKVSCRRDGSWFAIGDDAAWSYLLPSRLGRGGYELEVKAVDTAGNVAKVQRVRFRVR